MSIKDELILTEEQIAKNPAINPGIVKEAIQMRRELEKLGVWEDNGSRVSNTTVTKPISKAYRESKSLLITQNR